MPIYHFLAGLDPRLIWPGLLVAVLMPLAAAAPRLPHPQAWGGLAARGAGLALGGLVLWQLFLAGRYLFYPRYIDWIEPMVVAASWVGWRGGDFYPALSGSDVMGNWYGPVLYQLNGLSLWLFGPSIASSKILGVAAFAGEQWLTFWMLRRIGASRAEAIALACVQCLLQAGFASQGVAFGARADALLLLAALLGMVVATSKANFPNAALLGALMGVAANLKIHGVFYIVPAFFLFVSRPDSNIRRMQLVLVCGIATLAALALPFAMGGASLARYIDLFGLTRHHGFSKWILEKNIAFLAMLCSPLLLLYGLFAPKLPRSLIWFAAGSVPSMALVCVAGAVQGSGPYNLLSFVPPLLWAVATLLQAIRQKVRDGATEMRLSAASVAMIAAFLIGYGPILAMSWSTVLHEYSDAPRVRQAVAEIDEQMRKHPGHSWEVGPGAFHDLRVIPVFRGSPLAIDHESWADLNAGGADPAMLWKVIDSCRVEFWLMPAGGPLFADPDYPDLFPPAFVAHFRERYRNERGGRLFDRWRCIRGT